jgi:hypothetical protein
MKEQKQKKAGKGDKRAARRKYKVAMPKIKGSKKRRGRTSLSHYLRTGEHKYAPTGT